jgi:hypothetical protein
MVLSRTLPLWDASEYPRLECPYEDIRAAAAYLRRGPEPLEEEKPESGGLALRLHAWVRARRLRGLGDAPEEPRAEGGLAALPAQEAGAAPGGEPCPVWAIPLLAKATAEPSR